MNYCTIKLFNLYVFLLNCAGVQCAQCIHVQASKGVATHQPGGSDLRLMKWDDWLAVTRIHHCL